MRLLFSTMDLSAVKAYLTRTWYAMLEGRVPVQEYVFAKEVRLGTYSARGPLPPAAVVASKAMIADPRAEPRFGERIPFVVITGEPTARLVDLVVSPHQLLRSGGTLRLNNTYYIGKQVIPALARIFSLVGADLASWFADMRRPAPHRMRGAQLLGGGDAGDDAWEASNWQDPGARSTSGRGGAPRARPGLGGTRAFPPGGTRTIDQFYVTQDCRICGGQSKDAVCSECARDPQEVAFVALMRRARLQRSAARVTALCQACTGLRDAGPSGSAACDCLDCPVLYERSRLQHEVQVVERATAAVMKELL